MSSSAANTVVSTASGSESWGAKVGWIAPGGILLPHVTGFGFAFGHVSFGGIPVFGATFGQNSSGDVPACGVSSGEAAIFGKEGRIAAFGVGLGGGARLGRSR
ncbi:hypothetical protein [Acrocarpospora sp. B8E8]|uniref:hypothetical protein n=1 Tax=Acrocarpospora sp. B8E8 TaxID=3153572 RepID=UPI00325DBE01